MLSISIVPLGNSLSNWMADNTPPRLMLSEPHSWKIVTYASFGSGITMFYRTLRVPYISWSKTWI